MPSSRYLEASGKKGLIKLNNGGMQTYVHSMPTKFHKQINSARQKISEYSKSVDD